MTRNLSRETLARLAQRASLDRHVSVTGKNQLRVSLRTIGTAILKSRVMTATLDALFATTCSRSIWLLTVGSVAWLLLST